MKPKNIACHRMISQQIAATDIKTVKDMVGWMGAMQAQDYAMAKWAIGVRLPIISEEGVQTAINNGEIIRTHLLRPTWHFVSADDIYWMLDLSASQIKAKQTSRHKELSLTGSIFEKSERIFEQILKGGNHLNRDELIAELKNAQIATDENRASHIFGRAEIDGVLCSGPIKGGKQTYALLQERVPKKKSLSREEGLAELAKRYFNSRSPATVEDFIWWSGLSNGDAKHGFEIVRSELISEEIGSKTYWYTGFLSPFSGDTEDAFLLPAFDEFIISYKDRSASLSEDKFSKTVSSNGIFRPLIVVKGEIIGIWKRSIVKGKVILGLDFFNEPGKKNIKLIEKASLQYEKFIEKRIELTFISNSANQMGNKNS